MDERDALKAKEQLREELLFHAKNSSDRALTFWATATANALEGDEIAAANCQYLGDLNSDDALQEAYEAGEVDSTNPERGNDDDPAVILLLQSAGASMDFAMGQIMEAQTLFSEGSDYEEAREMAKKFKTLAIEHAYLAGKTIGNGRRTGIRPTFTMEPEEVAS